MNLKVGRYKSKNGATIGELWMDGKFFCYTLEDEIRPIMAKIYGNTAIPAGKYTLIVSYSQRFQQVMPEVLNVSGFKGIRIHTGNGISDTHGCLLVGDKTDGTKIWESKEAYTRLLAEIKTVIQSEKVFIEYVNTGKELKLKSVIS